MIEKKLMITDTVKDSIDWVSKFDEKTLGELKLMVDALIDKHGTEVYLEKYDSEYGSCGSIQENREETDQEYEDRMRIAKKIAEQELEREKRLFEMLYAKFGEPNKPKYLEFDEWKKIADFVFTPFKAAIGNDDVMDNFLRSEYKKYVEANK